MAGGRKIDDGQAPVRQRDAGLRIAPEATIIRPAMREAVGHRKRVPLKLIARARHVQHACNATHRFVQAP